MSIPNKLWSDLLEEEELLNEDARMDTEQNPLYPVQTTLEHQLLQPTATEPLTSPTTTTPTPTPSTQTTPTTYQSASRAHVQTTLTTHLSTSKTPTTTPNPIQTHALTDNSAANIIEQLFVKSIQANFTYQFEHELAQLNQQLAAMPTPAQGRHKLHAHMFETVTSFIANAANLNNLTPSCIGRIDSIVDNRNRFNAATWNLQHLQQIQDNIRNNIQTFIQTPFMTREDLITNIRKLMLMTNITSTTGKLNLQINTVTFRTENSDLKTVSFYIGLRANELIRNASLHINAIRKHFPTSLQHHHLNVLNATTEELLKKKLIFLYNLNTGITA